MSQVVTEPLAVVVERESPLFAGQDLARADPAAPHRRMADEERLRGGRGAQLQARGRVGRGRLQGPGDRAQPNLSYTWAAQGLETVVTWTLTPVDAGTRLRMEQVGFQPDQKLAYRGATAGWPRFFESLEGVVARIE
jgi:Uncharacterized conserved protein